MHYTGELYGSESPTGRIHESGKQDLEAGAALLSFLKTYEGFCASCSHSFEIYRVGGPGHLYGSLAEGHGKGPIKKHSTISV